MNELNPPERLLMGPGPSNVHPRVYKALSAPIVGHLDPIFLEVMEQSKTLLREVFETENELTIPISGTGSAGMETCFVNVVEPGDRVVIGVNGVFGQRMCDVAERCGAEVERVEVPWGQAIDPAQFEAALKTGGKTKLVAVVQAETSTGVLQPLQEIGALAREYDSLFLVDAVTSLGGVSVGVDAMGIDLCYSGTQKCLSCPPGLSPITLSDQAVSVLQSRQSKVQSWYLDLGMIAQYWGETRVYHHTAPISMNYALREALRLIQEEGLPACWARHRQYQEALIAGLQAMGLEPVVDDSKLRLPPLTTVKIPDHVDEAAVRKQLLAQFDIEIGGGLGVFQGKAWRIGLMGHTSKPKSVIQFLAALETCLGSSTERASGLTAAQQVLERT
ncbi:MAG: alanine--glyoxylate aminotransferase family protein [Gemmatimonadetes bacterium]|nr:alanine--glyoxylate aminotransferase family protein [Gemmatimonadota bacterium]MBT5141927.1 alanine--glyoxylate aminotransferase family protein [Gemmatimonadota bacterium]MBT5589783.1 alanine--glyoxylate aminotransferase family protein [Gemmatimonadota bacterium]MBT5964040.1 alanine--glyoxylate aminotransferase family protein [Gemmatimonadota bacterium]MBT6630009.1 alanine--glyoxylate aminotransferase family protein [Gemmatimonadota bacterium]